MTEGEGDPRPAGLPDVEADADVDVEEVDDEEVLDLHAWEGEIVDAADAMLDRALAYGMYVNKGRALPDVRDGLKPVQRRIVHAMDEIGARAGRPYLKSAGVVGHVIAHYHPHGDSSIYDAMVRMAQPFSLNVPLVDGQGNWGTVGPKEYSDPPAAYRYCLTGDARLRLADGRTVRIDEVAPGAEPDSDTPVDLRVIGLRGEAVRASVLFHSGHHPTLRLRTRDGFEVTGTANHPLLCLERAADGTPRLEWRTLGELRPGARVAVSRATAPLGRAGGERLGRLLGGVAVDGERVPEPVWGGGTAAKRAYLHALYAARGGFGATVRELQVSLRAPGVAAARDVQLLLTELGIVARIVREAGAGCRVVVDGHRDVVRFAALVGFADGRQRALERALQRRAARRTRHAAALRTGPAGGPPDGAVPWPRHVGLPPAAGGGSPASAFGYSTVESVQPAGVRPVYSIRVDTADHAFVANGLVNHNTEARLTPAATDWIADLRPEIVEFRPNFTEKRDEPWVLPVTFPNLLVNGSKGIGWSMACEVPPHNLAEACEAAILLAEEPDATLDDLLERMPGPDFPTGGIVVNPEALREAYERGQGTFRLQARFHLEQLPGNQQAIVVTELPYGISPDQVVAEVVKAARAERIQDVTELPKNLSDRSGLRVQVRVKRGGDATRLIADLMRHTSLRVSVGLNMTVLVNGAPRLVTLREALQHFVDFRFEVVTARLVHEREVLLRELHRLVALLAALDAIDEVVRIVRSADDDDDAREQLKALLTVVPHGSTEAVPLDDEQAQWILDMQIKRLSRLNRLRLEEERKAKGQRVDEIGRILESHDELRGLVVRELADAANRLGLPRRTTLGGEVRRVEEKGGKRAMTVVAQPRTDIWVFATEHGVAAAWPRATLVEAVPLEINAGETPLAPLPSHTEEELNAFAADGTVYRLRAAELPVSARPSKGVRAVAVGRSGRVAAMAPVAPEGGFLLLVTSRGEIKRVEASVFANSHASGSAAYDVPAGDSIVAVLPHGEGDHALLHSAHGQALRIELDRLRPVKSPGAGGVAGMRLDPGDEVVAVTLARDDEQLLVVHGSGHAKLVPIELYPVKGRGTGGVQSAAPDVPRREPAGLVATACALPEQGSALVLTLSGAMMEVAAASLEAAARAAVSRPLVQLVVGDEVVGSVAVPLAAPAILPAAT